MYDFNEEQKEIDGIIYELYGLNDEDIQEIETSYARICPKLTDWNTKQLLV
jgi:hypothetical protein